MPHFVFIFAFVSLPSICIRYIDCRIRIRVFVTECHIRFLILHRRKMVNLPMFLRVRLEGPHIVCLGDSDIVSWHYHLGFRQATNILLNILLLTVWALRPSHLSYRIVVVIIIVLRGHCRVIIIIVLRDHCRGVVLVSFIASSLHRLAYLYISAPSSSSSFFWSCVALKAQLN